MLSEDSGGLTAMSSLVLRELKQQDEKAFFKAIEQTQATDPNFAHYYTKGMSFEQYLRVLASVKLGFEIPKDHVPASVLYAFVGDWIVGRLTMRYNLNDPMGHVAGHIGYIVVPEFRKRGYSLEMLKQGLEVAKRADMPKILLTCDANDEASKKTIERAGGQFENTYQDASLKVPKSRFWVDFNKLY